MAETPGFGLVYEKNGKTAGVLAAIPMNSEYWNKITNGKLAGADLGERAVFNNSKDREMGLYTYLIQKLDVSVKGFYKTALHDLSKAVRKLKENNKDLKVIGFSGLCTTPEGINLFFNKLNCRERGYISSEHVIEKNGRRIIAETNSLKGINKKLSQGYRYITRCKMLVTYPPEPSIVWNYF